MTFLDAVDRADFDAKSAERTAPAFNVEVDAVRDDCLFRADGTAIITRDTCCSNFQFFHLYLG